MTKTSRLAAASSLENEITGTRAARAVAAIAGMSSASNGPSTSLLPSAMARVAAACAPAEVS